MTAEFHSIALLPAQFVSNKPDGFCDDDIGDELRSALARALRSRGYEVLTVPDRSPGSFALDPPTPDPGTIPDLLQRAPSSVDAAIGLWVEDYLATTLCEHLEAKDLEMGVALVLYDVAQEKELGRWRAREWDSGLGTSRDTIWAVTLRLTDRLLVGIP
ncbi:MAG: hypothetical protein RQ723_05965 [Desulfuromonadales bacterium]|nr:hypothetical protein [Desulfuromonadales bacterium]